MILGVGLALAFVMLVMGVVVFLPSVLIMRAATRWVTEIELRFGHACVILMGGYAVNYLLVLGVDSVLGVIVFGGKDASWWESAAVSIAVGVVVYGLVYAMFITYPARLAAELAVPGRKSPKAGERIGVGKGVLIALIQQGIIGGVIAAVAGIYMALGQS